MNIEINKERFCIFCINHKNGSVSQCGKFVKSKEYPFCKVHFRKRLTKEKINEDLNQSSDLICQEILLSGKNKGKCCSKNIFRHQFCFNHLQKNLTTCYYSNCDYLSLYPNGLCSYHCGVDPDHKPVSICPCSRHNYTLKESNNLYFCQQHYNQDCNCLEKYFSKIPSNEVILPDDLIELVYKFISPTDFPVLKCLNKYYNQFNYLNIIFQNIEKQIIKYIDIFSLPELSNNNNILYYNSVINYDNIINSINKNFIEENKILINENQSNIDLSQRLTRVFINTILEIYILEGNNVRSLFDSSKISDKQILKFIKAIYKKVILLIFDNEINMNNISDIIIDDYFDILIIPINVNNLSFIYNSNRYRFILKNLSIKYPVRIKFYNIFLLILYHQLTNLWPRIVKQKIIDYASFYNLGQQLITSNKCHESYQFFKDIHSYLTSCLIITNFKNNTITDIII